jgi:hypothetical protein
MKAYVSEFTVTDELRAQDKVLVDGKIESYAHLIANIDFQITDMPSGNYALVLLVVPENEMGGPLVLEDEAADALTMTGDDELPYREDVLDILSGMDDLPDGAFWAIADELE